MNTAVIRNQAVRLVYSAVLAWLAWSGILDAYDGTWEIFKYYTYLSNALTGLIFTLQTVCLTGTLAGRQWKLPAGIKGLGALAILFTFLTVFLVLNPFGAPSDWLDARIHYLVPLLAFAEWLLFEPHGTLRFWHPLLWLLTPMGYFGYVLVLYSRKIPFGTKRFPYFFMNFHVYGWGFVLKILLMLAGVFLLFGFLMLLYDRCVARLRRPAETAHHSPEK